MPPVIRLISLCFALCVTALPAWSACTQPADAAQRIAQTMTQINGYRQSAGLPALAPNPKLVQAATAHACDMAQMRKMSHKGSNGSTLPQRVKAQGYRFRVINENIGDVTPNAPVGPLWFASSGHKANILDRGITDLGLGLALGAGNRHYWVMVGGRSK